MKKLILTERQLEIIKSNKGCGKRKLIERYNNSNCPRAVRKLGTNKSFIICGFNLTNSICKECVKLGLDAKGEKEE